MQYIDIMEHFRYTPIMAHFLQKAVKEMDFSIKVYNLGQKFHPRFPGIFVKSMRQVFVN